MYNVRKKMEDRGFKKKSDSPVAKALERKGGHKQAEREARSRKAGFYVHGHKNFGDVYEK